MDEILFLILNSEQKTTRKDSRGSCAIDGKVGQLTNTIIGHSLFGAVTGGVVSNMQGGNFWEGAAIGFTIGLLNHAGKKLSEAIDGWLQEDPLKENADQVKHTLEQWSERYKDMSWSEIATERGWENGQPLGPNKEWRYIKAPDGKIMDMRHVAIVGYMYKDFGGIAVEFIQAGFFQFDSAFKAQDFYSNKIGDTFYQLRNKGNWASNSWSYDFKRFIQVHYKTYFTNYIPFGR